MSDQSVEHFQDDSIDISNDILEIPSLDLDDKWLYEPSSSFSDSKVNDLYVWLRNGKDSHLQDGESDMKYVDTRTFTRPKRKCLRKSFEGIIEQTGSSFRHTPKSNIDVLSEDEISILTDEKLSLQTELNITDILESPTILKKSVDSLLHLPDRIIEEPGLVKSKYSMLPTTSSENEIKSGLRKTSVDSMDSMAKPNFIVSGLVPDRISLVSKDIFTDLTDYSDIMSMSQPSILYSSIISTGDNSLYSSRTEVSSSIETNSFISELQNIQKMNPLYSNDTFIKDSNSFINEMDQTLIAPKDIEKENKSPHLQLDSTIDGNEILSINKTDKIKSIQTLERFREINISSDIEQFKQDGTSQHFPETEFLNETYNAQPVDETKFAETATKEINFKLIDAINPSGLKQSDECVMKKMDTSGYSQPIINLKFSPNEDKNIDKTTLIEERIMNETFFSNDDMKLNPRIEFNQQDEEDLAKCSQKLQLISDETFSQTNSSFTSFVQFEPSNSTFIQDTPQLNLNDVTFCQEDNRETISNSTFLASTENKFNTYRVKSNILKDKKNVCPVKESKNEQITVEDSLMVVPKHMDVTIAKGLQKPFDKRFHTFTRKTENNSVKKSKMSEENAQTKRNNIQEAQALSRLPQFLKRSVPNLALRPSNFLIPSETFTSGSENSLEGIKRPVQVTHDNIKVLHDHNKRMPKENITESKYTKGSQIKQCQGIKQVENFPNHLKKMNSGSEHRLLDMKRLENNSQFNIHSSTDSIDSLQSTHSAPDLNDRIGEVEGLISYSRLRGKSICTNGLMESTPKVRKPPNETSHRVSGNLPSPILDSNTNACKIASNDRGDTKVFASSSPIDNTEFQSSTLCNAETEMKAKEKECKNIEREKQKTNKDEIKSKLRQPVNRNIPRPTSGIPRPASRIPALRLPKKT
ncbi:uncharacterized protein [Prorops nasuta]|uniref:uncharacterized protein n=1 Tax=Prorops nasuta TaxID=863751 RepID=UPI0034CF29DE